MTAKQAHDTARAYRKRNPHPKLSEEISKIMEGIERVSMNGGFSYMHEIPRPAERDERLYSEVRSALLDMGYEERAGNSDPWLTIVWFNIKTP